MTLEPITADPPRAIVKPASRQRWLDLTFLHWTIGRDTLRRQIPRELELDLYDGKAWIGLVPFNLQFGGMGTFPETNVRTYVYDAKGRRGVWFFSLDAARLAAVVGARIAYGLPYYWNTMSVVVGDGTVAYRSKRLHGPEAVSDIVVRPGTVIDEPSEFEHFLTARWRLFARRFGRVVSADVDHPRWPLQKAVVEKLDQNLVPAIGEPLVHFSKGVDVRATWARNVSGAGGPSLY